jgi:hypothetical protein
MCGAAKLPLQILHGCNSLNSFNCLPIVILLKYCAAMPQNCDGSLKFQPKSRAKATGLPRYAAMHQIWRLVGVLEALPELCIRSVLWRKRQKN